MSNDWTSSFSFRHEQNLWKLFGIWPLEQQVLEAIINSTKVDNSVVATKMNV